MILLGWNALIFFGGGLFVLHFLELREVASSITAIATLFSCTPHLIFKVTSYILAGMSGTFLSKAVFKYSLFSIYFQQVLWTCIYLLLSAIACLIISALFEFYLAGSIYRVIFP